MDIGAVLMQVAGDFGRLSGTNLRDGGDDLALFGIEGRVFEKGIGIFDVFSYFIQHSIWEAREEALKSLPPEVGMGRDGGKRMDEGAPMGRVWVEGARMRMALEEVNEDGGGVGEGGHLPL